VDFRTDYEKGFRDLAQALEIRNAPAVPASPSETVNVAQKRSATGLQVEAGKRAEAEAQAVQPARLAEQPSPVIAASETRVQEDHRKIGEGQPVLTEQRIWFKPRILWATGAGLIVLVLIIWGISSKAPIQSDGSAQVTPTATPAASPAPTSAPTPVSTRTPLRIPDNSRANNAQTFYQRGYDLYGKKQYDQAIDALTQAIRLKPDYAEAYNERGMAYDEKGDMIGRSKTTIRH
jgi:tetratricopeptide (TPR) repeat protein